MNSPLIAEVHVESATLGFDKPFSYLVPFDMADKIAVGQRVSVPFGRSNKKRVGVITALRQSGEKLSVIKPIAAIIDSVPLLTDE
ncbi:MAG: primosomal protein N', partial [Acutalibacteraceae bacterium]